ncbi:MAG: peptidase M1 [Bacteroidetes bacterium]|nr:peptidase M1 [Bacteroidota bacterium]
MKSFILLIAISFFTCGYLAAQSNNLEITKQVAAIEKAKFDSKMENKAPSLASNNFTVNYYRCNWNIDPAVRYISGSVTSYIIITTTTNQVTFDLSKALTVDSIIFHATATSFTQKNNQTLVINLPVTLNEGAEDSLTIFYHGVPPNSGDFTGGFSQTKHNGTPVIWTLSEPYGASGWWPCRNGLDDKADSIDIYITHPSQYKASSNGVLMSEISNGSTTTSYYKHRYPIATYLVAIAVTNYSIINNNIVINGKSMPVIQYIYPEDLSSFQTATPIVLNALQLYSDYFGNYPFIKERYGQTEFSWGGGMEHQTNSFVIGAGTNLMTHELGHQWFGDRVTCGSWQDIWLNEGFANWLADMFYTEKIDSANYKSNVLADLLYITSAPGGSVWVKDTSNSDRIFDTRLTYDKGSFLVRMLRWELGDSLFFKGIKKYLRDPKLSYGFARTADLQRHLQQVSGKNLDYFFNQWFYGEGYPSVTVKWKDSSNNKIYFTVSQTTSKPSSVSFFKLKKLPVQVSNGKSKRTYILNFKTNNQEFVFNSPSFNVKSVVIDPDNYLITKNNKVIAQTLQPMTDISSVVVNPNPVTSSAQIVLKNMKGKVQMFLFDNSGNRMWNKEVDATTNSMTIPISFSAFSNGTYTLFVYDDNGIKHSVTIIK